MTDLVPGLLAGRATFAPPAPVVAVVGPALRVTVGAGPDPVGTFTAANVGLSFELSDLDDPQWDPGSSTLDELVLGLGRPALRFGGNSADRRVWWTSTEESRPAWATTTVRPADLQRLARFLARTGTTVTLVLPLGHYGPARAADFALHARSALGDRLVGVSFGNEPNGFVLDSQPQLAVREPGWGTAAFVTEARAYERAVHARVPGLPLIGPGAYDAMWWRAFGDAHLPDTAALTAHWYPLWSCPGRLGPANPNATPTAANLVSRWQHDRAGAILGAAVATAASYRLPLWLEETGPTSCAGTNDSSRTHAQALWTVDYVLHAASVGVQRMAMHSSLAPCDGGPPMSVVCSAQLPGRTRPVLTGQANDLALMFAAQIRPGAFVPVTVSGSDVTDTQRVFAYAVKGVGGIDLVLVNLDDPTAVGAATVTLSLPKGSAPRAASVLFGRDLLGRNATELEPLASLPADGPGRLQLNPGSALLVRIAVH